MINIFFIMMIHEKVFFMYKIPALDSFPKHFSLNMLRLCKMQCKVQHGKVQVSKWCTVMWLILFTILGQAVTPLKITHSCRFLTQKTAAKQDQSNHTRVINIICKQMCSLRGSCRKEKRQSSSFPFIFIAVYPSQRQCLLPRNERNSGKNIEDERWVKKNYFLNIKLERSITIKMATVQRFLKNTDPVLGLGFFFVLLVTL